MCAEFAVFLATTYALAKGLITELELTKHFGSHSARFPSLSGQKWQGPQLVAEYLSALVLFSSRKIPPFYGTCGPSLPFVMVHNFPQKFSSIF